MTRLPDGVFASATAINAAGNIVGTRGSPQRAILWPVDGGSVVLGCPEDAGPDAALAINSAGTVVGYRGVSPSQAVVWMAGACRQDLPPLSAGNSAEARAIDGAGNIAGHAYDAQNYEWAVRWTLENGTWAIRTLDDGQHAAAWGMNSAGDIVGSGCPGATAPPCQDHAFLWPATGGKIDLGTLGGVKSAAFAINAAQEVVGWSYTRVGTRHAFIWTAANGMRDLGTLRGDRDSEASGVNNVAPDGTRQVVGFSQASSGSQRALVAKVN